MRSESKFIVIFGKCMCAWYLGLTFKIIHKYTWFNTGDQCVEEVDTFKYYLFICKSTSLTKKNLKPTSNKILYCFSFLSNILNKHNEILENVRHIVSYLIQWFTFIRFKELIHSQKNVLPLWLGCGVTHYVLRILESVSF